MDKREFKKLKRRIADNKTIDFDHDSSLSSFCIDLIKKCTDIDQEKRPSFDQIIDDMNYNYFQLTNDVDFETVSKRYQMSSFYLDDCKDKELKISFI